MDEDIFDYEYEDELEAMQELEDGFRSPPDDKGSAKRGLFSEQTPQRTRADANKLNDSFPIELEQTPQENKGLKRTLEMSPELSAIKAEPVQQEQVYKKSRKCLTSEPTQVTSMPTEADQLDEDDDMECFSSIEIFVKAQKHNETVVEEDVLREKILPRIPNCDYTPISSHDLSKTGFIKIKKLIKVANLNSMNKSKSVGLLSTSISTLIRKVEQMRNLRTLERIENKTDDLTSRIPADNIRDDIETRLWVEKYTPDKYVDLLSNEGVNRALLKWLKLWDHVVFGKPLPRDYNSKLQAEANKENTQKGGEKGKKVEKWDKKMGWLGDEALINEQLDNVLRPGQKVVLIAGRAGLGKTTLAHIAARHAGYHPIEINASDERSASAFNSRIDDSLSMRPLLASDPRPNLLILDEIDGAGAPAINALLTRLNIGGPDKENEGGVKKKKKDKQQPILRPIICICNDLYTPSLRGLRSVALVLNMPEQCPSRLALRLQEICDDESLKTDTSVLMSLSSKAGNDVRSCLNTLQFIQKRQTRFTMSDVHGSDIGAKDEQKTLFSLWSDVFSLPRQKKTVMPSLYRTEVKPEIHADCCSLSGRFKKIYNDSQTTGEYNRVATGLHENFLNVKYKDARWKLTCQGFEWLCYSDVIQRYIMSNQAFTLIHYTHLVPVVFHLNFAQNNPPKTIYPRRHHEITQRIHHSESLLDTLYKDMDLMTSLYCSPTTLAVDIIQPLVDIIIQPTMRPVSAQLYSQQEKLQVARVVGIMIDYNLKYMQIRSGQTGQYQYLLDPAVNELSTYSDAQSFNKPLSYAARQLVNTEVTNEVYRRRERKTTSVAQSNTPSTSSSNPPKTPSNRKALSTSTPVSKRAQLVTEDFTPNHRIKLTPKQITPSNRTPRDFFGRRVEKKEKEISPEAQAELELNKRLFETEIYYRFKEGYSNAVRKRVKLSQLL